MTSSSCGDFGCYDTDLELVRLCGDCDPKIRKMCIDETRIRCLARARLAASAPRCYANYGQPLPGMTCGACAWEKSCSSGQASELPDS